MNFRDFRRFLVILVIWGPLCLLPDDPAILILGSWFGLIMVALLSVGFPYMWQIMLLVFVPGGAVGYVDRRFGVGWAMLALFFVIAMAALVSHLLILTGLAHAAM